MLAISDGDITEDGKLWTVVQISGYLKAIETQKKSLVRLLSSLGYLGSIHVI